MTSPRIGCDIDGVLSNFTQGIIDLAKDLGIGADFPSSWLTTDRWNFSERFSEVWKLIENEPDFWVGLSPFPAAQLHFRPDAFVTARPVNGAITTTWLERHGFYRGQIIVTVPPGTSKVQTLKELGVGYFIDDNIDNWNEINNAGITCFLLDRPWNRSVDASETRIKTLDEVMGKVLEA